MKSATLTAIASSGSASLRLERLIRRFEDAWKRGERPCLNDYLPPIVDIPGEPVGPACRAGPEGAARQAAPTSAVGPAGPEGAARQAAPTPPLLRAMVLVELVHTDLEYRLRAGEPARVEDYRARYPELRTGAAFLDLIAAEWEIRRCCGQDAEIDEYLRRFPEHASRLPGLLRPSLPRSAPEAAPLPAAGEGFGRFELLEVLGGGAFGVVYKARDRRLQRLVALKVLRPERLPEREERERFLREARGAARLSHPAIVPVFEAGEADGACFLVSAFVEGQTLAQWLRAGRPAPEQAASLTAQLAEGLHAAHVQGVVHRDVKPSNILLDGEGRPHLVDFGLAKFDGGATLLTEAGDVLGTPAYMPPEQARGDAHQADARSDVYSLGVVLYEMLTGEAPFRGTPRRVLAQVMEEEPRPPRRLNERVPRDLETVCLKAMAKVPGDRYATAADFAADVRRFLSGQAVRARPVGAAGKLWRWARRRPGPALLAASLLVALTGGVGGVTGAMLHADHQRRQAEKHLAEAERERARAKEDFHKAHQALADLIEAGLRETPANRPVPPFFLEQALAYYRDFLRQRGDEPHLAVEAALAQANAGDIERGLWRKQEAREAYADAVARWRQIVAAHPAEIEYQAHLNWCLLRLGEMNFVGDHPEEALALWEQSRSWAQERTRATPDDVGPLVLLAVSLYNLGLLHDQRGQAGEALACFREAYALAPDLLRREPDAVEFRAFLAETGCKLAACERGAGHRAEAVQLYRESRGLFETLLGERGKEIAPGGWGRVCVWQSALYLEALQPLTSRHPSSDSLRAYLAHCWFWEAALLDRMDEPDGALCGYRQAAEGFAALARQMPDEAHFRRDQAACLHCMGNLFRETLQPEKAVAAYHQALALRRDLVRQHPDEKQHRHDLRGTWRKLGMTLMLMGRLAEAREAYRQADDPG